MPKTNSEKVVTLEVKMENLSQRVEDNYKSTTIRFDKIDLSIQEVKNIVSDKYVNKDNFTEKIDDLKRLIEEQNKTIDSMEKKSNFWKWAAPTLSAAIATIFTGVVVFLLIEYLRVH